MQIPDFHRDWFASVYCGRRTVRKRGQMGRRGNRTECWWGVIDGWGSSTELRASTLRPTSSSAPFEILPNSLTLSSMDLFKTLVSNDVLFNLQTSSSSSLSSSQNNNNNKNFNEPAAVKKEMSVILIYIWSLVLLCVRVCVCVCVCVCVWSGRQWKCWMDNVTGWMSLPKPELLTTASRRHDWKRISAESSLKSPRRTKSSTFSFRVCPL